MLISRFEFGILTEIYKIKINFLELIHEIYMFGFQFGISIEIGDHFFLKLIHEIYLLKNWMMLPYIIHEIYILNKYKHLKQYKKLRKGHQSFERNSNSTINFLKHKFSSDVD